MKHPRNRAERLEIKQLKRKPRRTSLEAMESADEIEIRQGHGSDQTPEPVA